jgi:hypothetical protein
VRGTLSGLAAAEHAAGQPGPLARGMAQQPEPTRLPPAPLDRIGATATLRWKEWRATGE